MGNNKFGSRTKQAAEYPVGLAEAICEGVRGQMKFDYAMNLKLDAAYPAEERERSRSPRREAEEHEAPEPMQDEEQEGQAAPEAPEPEPMGHAPGLRGRACGRARGRGRGVMPGARGAGQHRARPT